MNASAAPRDPIDAQRPSWRPLPRQRRALAQRGTRRAASKRRAGAPRSARPGEGGSAPGLQSGLALALLLGLAAVWWAWRGGAGPVGPAGGGIGGVTACQRQPRFAVELGMVGSAIGTSIEGVEGLAVVDPSRPGVEGVYQHPSWDDYGYLGPFTYDAEGNVYTAPVPLVSLEENPLGEQNRILRVDTDTQRMSELVDLPPAREPSAANPFGVVGLAYDCETGSLYASSLAGSTAGAELGRVFQVDPASGRVLAILEGVDAMGLGVFRGAGGKRLYLGRTREPAIHSVALDDSGAFVGAPRPEIELVGLTRGGLDTARRLSFGAGPTLNVKTMDFGYSLQVAGEREELSLDLVYDPSTGGWTLAGGR